MPSPDHSDHPDHFDHPDPRDVALADVLKGGVLAATLARTEAGVVFRYLPEYLDLDHPAVATTLPKTDEPTVTPRGAVPPYFAGLLPEGRRLTALRRAVKTSADDDLSLLVAVGADPVGDVQVLPHGSDLPAMTGRRAAAVAANPRDFTDLDFADLRAEAGIIDPSALAGVQDKVSGRMITIPLAHDGAVHLLKLTPPEFPLVVENEQFFLDVARRLRRRVVEARVVHDRYGASGLLVTRFDRVPNPDGTVGRRPVEDAAQLLGRYPADKYAVTMEQVTAAVSAVTAARAPAVRDVFVQLVFAWLTGNGDLHAKNISVLGEPTGTAGLAEPEWRVSPTYDIPSTLPYGDRTLALSVGGRRDVLTRRQLLDFAENVGLPHRAAERALADVLAATDDVVDRLAAGAIAFDPRQRRDLIRVLRARREKLEVSTAS